MHHQKTRLYRRTLDLIQSAKQTIQSLPPGQSQLADQLRRASTSVLLNFSEGCGKQTPKDRRRFFTIARGSLYEVAAIYDIAHIHGHINDADHTAVQDHCDHIAAMLHRFR